MSEKRTVIQLWARVNRLRITIARADITILWLRFSMWFAKRLRGTYELPKTEANDGANTD